MVSLISEILGTASLAYATYVFANDASDWHHWLFNMLFAIILYQNANRYEKD